LEEIGFTIVEMNIFLQACTFIIQELSPNDSRSMSLMRPNDSAKIPADTFTTQMTGKYAARSDAMKKDWIRFVTFVRLCLLQLISTDRKI
jgi:hypothetical protein